MPVMLQPDDADDTTILFPALSVTFINRNSTILPFAISLAAVPVDEMQSLDERPLLFRSLSMVRVLELHNWAIAEISDTFRLRSTSSTRYVFNHLYYLTTSARTAALLDLDQVNRQ